jgi:putative transposase
MFHVAPLLALFAMQLPVKSTNANALGSAHCERIREIRHVEAPGAKENSWDMGGQMPVGRKTRHSTEEIATKLAQANELATQGRLQSEIARTLGVSIMTLHRWRKTPPEPRLASLATRDTSQPERMRTAADRIAELQLENSRLRRLVTDLLLEKMKLEEAAQSNEFSDERTK